MAQNNDVHTLDMAMEHGEEYDSEATLDISLDVDGASDQQLWMFAELATMVEDNYTTLVEKNLDYGTAFLNGAVREHVGSASPFEDAMESSLYRLFTRSSDKRDRFQEQVFGEGDDLVNEDAVETALDNANYWLLIAWTLENGEEHIDMLLDDLEQKKAVIDEQVEKPEYQEGTGIAYSQ